MIPVGPAPIEVNAPPPPGFERTQVVGDEFLNRLTVGTNVGAGGVTRVTCEGFEPHEESKAAEVATTAKKNVFRR